MPPHRETQLQCQRRCPQHEVRAVAAYLLWLGGLLIQSGYRLRVEGVGIFVRVADRRQPHQAQLGERVHHVEDDAPLPRLIEMQAMADGDVEELLVGERAIRR